MGARLVFCEAFLRLYAQPLESELVEKNDIDTWRLDKHIPVALIVSIFIALAGQGVYVVTWGKEIEAKQMDFERRITAQETNKVGERLAVFEYQQRQSADFQKEMNAKLDRILEKQFGPGR